jgi:hypothetical protein
MTDKAPRLRMVLEMSVSEAEDFLVALAIGLAGTVVPTEPPVPVAATPEPEPVLVEFNSWNKMWGEFSGVADGDVVLALDGKREIVGEFNMLELENELDVVVLDMELEVDAGEELDLGVGVGVGVGVGEGLEEAALDEPEAEESPAGNRTTVADWPSGIVTTQKFAPPAPDASSGLVTPPIPFTEGSMEQGRPLQPEPEHSTLRPNDGRVPLSELPVKIGFQPILK